MNYDFNNIERYLADGGNAEELANAFASKLNAAIEENKRADALEELTKAWNAYVDVRFSKKSDREKYYANSTGEMRAFFNATVELTDTIDAGIDTVNRFFKRIGVN